MKSRGPHLKSNAAERAQSGSPSWIRTSDLPVNSRLLGQASCRGTTTSPRCGREWSSQRDSHPHGPEWRSGASLFRPWLHDLELAARFALASLGYRPRALLLSYASERFRELDSNQRFALQRRLSYQLDDPGSEESRGSRSRTGIPRVKAERPAFGRHPEREERAAGVEPASPVWKTGTSAARTDPQNYSAAGRARTCALPFKRRLLSRLSYSGDATQEIARAQYRRQELNLYQPLIRQPLFR